MAARPYNAFFITHDAGYYGASRSLQALVREYDSRHVELAVNRRIFGTNDIGEILTRFGPHVSRVREFFLPFERCFKGKPPNSMRLFLRNAAARVTRPALHGFIRKSGFDFTHLNSLVLHPLIREDLPFIVHVREIHEGSDRRAYRSLCRARGVIFIDEATRQPFGDLPVPSILLNNPVDMRGANTAKASELRAALGGEEAIVFGVIGQINENKGTAFIIEAFLAARTANAVLFIVGEGERSYIEHCRSLADGRSNIVFHGFEPDVASVYAALDYVLRGEAYPCVGRTIYEGLYAGCGVIVPGAGDGAGMFDFDRHRKRTFFYSPRSKAELAALFSRLSGEVIARGPATSNVDQFVERFDSFVAHVLRSGNR